MSATLVFHIISFENTKSKQKISHEKNGHKNFMLKAGLNKKKDRQMNKKVKRNLNF